MAISEKNLPDLRKYLSTLPYVNKYNQTSQLINRFDNFDFAEHVGVLKILYEDLLNDFPFNNKWWIKYAEKYASISQEVRSIEIYQQASNANPSSVEIWHGYLTAILKAGTSDSEFVIKNFEKAIECVHLDHDAEKIYDAYLGYLESKNYQNHELTTDAFFWRLKSFPLSESEKYVARYEKFIDSLDQPIYFQLTEIHADLNLPNEKIFKRELLKNAYGIQLKSSMGRAHYGDDGKKLLQLMDNKTEFDGAELNAKNVESIKELLRHYKTAGPHHRTIFLYRKALTLLANDGAFWTEYLHLLNSHESTKPEVENCFKIYTHHFKLIKNKESLLFYQADFKEAKHDIVGAREAYTDLEKLGNFEAYIRHIYMEIRTNNASNVFEIFSSLSKAVEDPDQMIFALQEIGDILNKLGDADRAIEVIKQFSEKGDYSKFFLATWVNFLKSCQKPWDDLEEVFLYSLSKAKTSEDKHEIWKLYLYTARGYCSDVNLIREIERKFAVEHEHTLLENGVNKKRKLDNPDNEEKELRKQVKSD